RQLSMARRLMCARLQWYLIGAFAEFDHYPTRRDWAILGPPLAVKLRERCQWLEWGTVSGVLVGAPFAAFDCRVSHRHPAIICRWSGRRRPPCLQSTPRPPSLAQRARSQTLACLWSG